MGFASFVFLLPVAFALAGALLAPSTLDGQTLGTASGLLLGLVTTVGTTRLSMGRQRRKTRHA